MPSLEIKPPLAGVKRNLGFQNQEPYSLAEAVNFWPIDPYSMRATLATRPFVGAFDTPGDSGALGVNMATLVNGTASETPTRTAIVGLGGTVYRWTGSAFTAVGGAGSIPTDRAVYAWPFLQKVIIATDTTAPLVYDYPSDTLSTLTASAGTVPTDCRVVVTWQGCVVMTGSQAEPHVVNLSRTGDETDWDFSATDAAGAFAFTGENEGLVGEPLGALVPHTEDILLLGGADTLYALTGHPRGGGVLTQISSSVGIIGQGAWTRTPDGQTYFLGLDGMYTVQGLNVLPVSKDIPNDIRGIAYDLFDPVANLEYDSRFDGLIVTFRGDDAQAWFFHLPTRSWWGMEFSAYPTTTLRFDPVQTGTKSGVLLCGTGYGGVGRFDLDATSETGWEYACKIGPVKISPSLSRKFRIARGDFAFALPTDDPSIAFDFYVGDTAEDSYGRAQAAATDRRFRVSSERLELDGGTCRPHLTGHALTLAISESGVTDSRLTFDGGVIELVDAGY